MTSTNLLHAKRALAVLAVLMVLVAILPPMLQAAPPQDGSIVYYVQFGDTLFSIAQRYGTTVPALMAANGLTSYSIYAGQRLFVPLGYSPYGYQPYSSIFAPQPLPTQQLIANPTFGCPYTVQFRDTVFSIAYRYHVTVPSLMQANNLYTPIIYVGRPLNVPCTSPTPTPFQVYTVQSGDNLFRIAIKYNTTIYALALVNGIPNPSLIFAGQGLVVAYPGSYIWPYIPSPSYAATNVVISQFRTRGPRGADDEFIELYNPTTSSVSIGGWLIKVSNGSGTVDTRVTISSGVQLTSGQHYLIANSASDGYNGSVTADQTYTTDIADDGGIALTMADSTIVDQVGLSSGSAYKEGTILTPLTANNDQGYERKPGGSSGNCTDSNNNAADLYVQAPSEPRDAASVAIAPTCQATPTPTTTATATPTPTATATVAGTTQIVILSSNTYIPNVITITHGTTIQWKNTDNTNHTVSSGTGGALDGIFRSPTLAQNQTYSFTFNTPNTYPYFCEIHGVAMSGSVVVQ